jgi:hypothetical protein
MLGPTIANSDVGWPVSRNSYNGRWFTVMEMSDAKKSLLWGLGLAIPSVLILALVISYLWTLAPPKKEGQTDAPVAPSSSKQPTS